MMLDWSIVIPLAAAFSAAVAGIGAIFFDSRILARRGHAAGNAAQISEIELPHVEEPFNHQLVLDDDCAHLSSEQANEGVRRIVRYAYDLRPDYIVGINRGGAMIGAFVSLAAGIPDSKFIKCGLTSANEDYELDLEKRELHGTILIIDDITRSGNTLKHIREKILELNPIIKNVFIATLVAVCDEKNKTANPIVSYASILTRRERLTLPWSKKSDKSTTGSKDANLRRREEYRQVAKSPVKELAVEVYESID